MDIKIENGEIGDANQYHKKTNREIRELALSLRAGQAFGSWMIPEHDQRHLNLVFMPLAIMNEIQHKTLIRDGVVHFYGFMSDAAPRSINGMPMFFSMHCLDKEDADRLSAALKSLEDFMKDYE